jgi:uncharacterized protein (DUF302 family)
MTTGPYYFSTTVDEPLDQAAENVTALLAEEGFGILTEIDVAATLKKKLGVDFRPYRILGACNPQFAHEALQVEDKIGTMLPCNVILQATDDGRTEVVAVDPVASMQAVERPELESVAKEVRTRLQSVISRL